MHYLSIFNEECLKETSKTLCGEWNKFKTLIAKLNIIYR